MSEKKKKSFALVVDGGGSGGTTTITDTTTNTVILTGVMTDSTKGIVPSATDPASPSKGVLGELIEAFGEISTAFNSLGSSFGVFGDTINNQALGLGDTMRSSVDSIKNSVNDLMIKFKLMGSNLSANLKP